MSLLESWLGQVRESAENKAFELETEKVENRREHERFMRERGQSGPWDDITLEDVELLKEENKFELLLEEKGFFERVQFLEQEREASIQAIKSAGEKAVLHAAENVPPDLEDLIGLEQERQRFLYRVGVRSEDIGSAPETIRQQYLSLIENHERKLREFESKSA